jgi:hypothetical protein
MPRITSRAPSPPGMKYCPRCQQDKPYEAFAPSKGALSLKFEHRATYCIECHREYDRQYRAAHEPQIAEWRKRRHERREGEKATGVYIVDLKLEGGGLFKIGHTNHMADRMAHLTAANPNVKMVCFIKTDAPIELEKAIHAQILNRRVTREIYKLTGEQLRGLLEWIGRDYGLNVS